MAYTNNGVTWFTCFRDDKQSDKPKHALLSFYPNAFEKKYVISRERRNQEESFYNYASFDSHWDIFHFLKKEPQWRRQYHEVIPELREQKPRFDIDIDLEKYRMAKKIAPEIKKISFGEVGDYVKDMVIRAVCKVMSKNGMEIDLDADIMLFSSHNEKKRSYHLILNRYFHSCSGQAYAFYLECKKVASSPELFDLLVDAGIYNKNHSIRMLWCNKLGDLNRVKKYTPEFTYRGKTYRHTITQYFEGYDETEYDDELIKLIVFGSSLITFTPECSPMPKFAVKTKKYKEFVEIDADTYEECKKMIEKWDVNGIFEVRDTEKGRILLKRLQPSDCSICKRVHHKVHPFCYILNASLYWHCIQGKGKPGILIGRIPGKISRIEMRICEIFELKNASILDEDGNVMYKGETTPVRSNDNDYDAEIEFRGKKSSESEFLDSLKEEVPLVTIRKAPLPAFITKYLNPDKKALQESYQNKKVAKKPKRLSDSTESSSEESSSSETGPKNYVDDIRNPKFRIKETKKETDKSVSDSSSTNSSEEDKKSDNKNLLDRSLRKSKPIKVRK